MAESVLPTSGASPGGTSEGDAGESDPPLRSVHTASFGELLARHGVSVAFTTYQAGKLVLLRPQPAAGGVVINTHFRDFDRPMGLAWRQGRLAIGTATAIWEYHDVPAVGAKLGDTGSPVPCDSVFVPRRCHITGDVQIHELNWVRRPGSAPSDGPELWFVNTRFSCLASRGDDYSFVPRWQPPFVSALAPDDRCHVNGMCVRDGRVRYVTALGETDAQGGWREHKARGGVLVDVAANAVLTRGLSMPHSPRWHNGVLWLLESGNGGVGFVDERTGRYQEVCRLPGFTRGLDFAGPIAFVGLSQVRDTAVFSGIGIADMPMADRRCGVWAVDTRSGQVVGFVSFTGSVQEVFAVKLLVGSRWPEVLPLDSARVADTYEIPDEALGRVPAQLRHSAASERSDRGRP